MKRMDGNIEDILIKLCEEKNVKAYYKSSCCAAHLHNKECWVHNIETPVNLEIAKKLGYQFSIIDSAMVLEVATTGDLNFLRMLTKSEVKCKSLLNNYNLLSCSCEKRKLECTSSWFCWSTNTNKCIDCNYCIIKQIEYLKKKKIEIGCEPKELEKIILDNIHSNFLEELKQTKIKNPEIYIKSKFVEYKDVRVVKPCMCK